jgi:hypothetical protein
VNEFLRDNLWQREIRDRILAPYFYQKYSVQGRYVFIDKGALASQIQKEFAVDTIVQGKNGAAICIEEKIARWPKPPKRAPLTAFALETKSCTVPGHEKTGWMSYGQADYLMYCFANEAETSLDCYLIKFPDLQKWFWPQHLRWPRSVSNQINKTECRIVSIDQVKENIGFYRRVISGESNGNP